MHKHGGATPSSQGALGQKKNGRSKKRRAEKGRDDPHTKAPAHSYLLRCTLESIGRNASFLACVADLFKGEARVGRHAILLAQSLVEDLTGLRRVITFRLFHEMTSLGGFRQKARGAPAPVGLCVPREDESPKNRDPR